MMFVLSVTVAYHWFAFFYLVSSADMLTDELKRRMTYGQGALTPRVVHKTGKAP